VSPLEAALLWAVPLTPLLLLGAILLDRTARRMPLLAAAGALPGLLAAALLSDATSEASWVLLGARLEVDGTARVFLAFTATLWFLGSVYAHGYLRSGRARFVAFWLITMSANLGVVVAGDAVTFYCTFVVMTFAAYGLVVHDRSDFARRAGRLYIVMSVLGEVAVLTGLLAAVWVAQGELGFEAIRKAVAASPHRELIVALLVAGFGVKAGLAFLHMWLPLAHPAAPVPASAVLSGAMIKVGLLGWLRFLPLDDAALPTGGAVLVAFGFIGAFGAVIAGLPQRDPKVVLAYSSVSQIGVMAVLAGLLLGSEGVAIAGGAALGVYALHHGLAKGALFLGIPLAAATAPRTRRLAFAGLVLTALAIAGAPLSGGMVAKGALKDVAGALDGGAAAVVLVLLPFTSIATTLLLARYVQVASTATRATVSRWQIGAWIVATLAALSATWLLPASMLAGIEVTEFVYAGALWEATWPVVLGVALAGGAVWFVRRGGIEVPQVAPGDLVVLVERGGGPARAAWRGTIVPGATRFRAWTPWVARRFVTLLFAGDRVERGFGVWTVAGSLFIALVALLILLGGDA
jgi:formate hydrogenlyase subunit 3/multisubunit Na+/H+ antiporter MnhD subunit